MEILIPCALVIYPYNPFLYSAVQIQAQLTLMKICWGQYIYLTFFIKYISLCSFFYKQCIKKVYTYSVSMHSSHCMKLESFKRTVCRDYLFPYILQRNNLRVSVLYYGKRMYNVMHQRLI